MVYYAHYRLTDPQLQIRSYVFDVIRSEVPRMTLDEAFTSKSRIAHSVQTRLQKVMKEYGYGITCSLVTNISPTPIIKMSMNAIEAARRRKSAMAHKGEAGQSPQS